MRVALISPGLPADEADTTCIPSLQSWLRQLPEKLDLQAWSLHYPHRSGAYSWNGLSFTSAGCPRNPVRRVFRSLATTRQIVRRHRRQPFDLLHGLWLTDAAVIALLAGRLIRRPVVLTAMGQDVLPTNRYLPLVRRLSRKETIWVATCERSADLLAERRIGSGQTRRIVPWGIDRKGVPAASLERPIDLLGVGSLTANKDYDTLLDIVVELRRHAQSEPGGPSIRRVELLGDGPLHGHLAERIRRERLQHIVHLKGHVDNSVALNALRATRVLLHPARFEGYGFVFQEALAEGAAIVSRPRGCAPLEARPNWRLFETVTQGADEVTSLLRPGRPTAPGEAERVGPTPVSTTVRGYAEVYGRGR